MCISVSVFVFDWICTLDGFINLEKFERIRVWRCRSLCRENEHTSTQRFVLMALPMGWACAVGCQRVILACCTGSPGAVAVAALPAPFCVVVRRLCVHACVICTDVDSGGK